MPVPTPKTCLDQVNILYNTHHLCCDGYYTLALSDTTVSLWKLFTKAIKAIFYRQNTDTLDEDITIKEYETLHDALHVAAAARHINLTDYRDPQARTLQRLRTNLITFVAFKNYNRSQDMIRALTDEHGKIRSFAAFQREAIKLGESYLRHQLEAEYTTVVAAAQSAAQWDDFIRQAHIYPYLVYKTQHDDKVRPAHDLLHDVARHIDDAFWDIYYPPNGWRCRCYVLQAKSDQGYRTEPDAYPDDKSLPPVFRHNPAKSGKVWNNKHPYFQHIKPEIKKKILRTKFNLLNNQRLFDVIDGIEVHYSNYGNDNFLKELNIAKTIQFQFPNNTIQILPQIEEKGLNIPDFKIGDTLLEYKSFDTVNISTIEKQIIHATIQLTNNRYKDVQSRIVLVQFNNNVDEDRIVGKFNSIDLVKQYNMQLWIRKNETIIKHKVNPEQD
ncbi:MAG TPA: phage minor head protein [Saprospiraceae bacterium]|nr:phage minor head protein [Saprospiraceae bacterium]HRP41967.1 phage minor head protein [Saprospiraceae bacterium]